MKAVGTQKKVTVTLLVITIMALIAFTIPVLIHHRSTSMDPANRSYMDLAQAIMMKYDQELHRLDDYKASHYAARIYRISGDTAHIAYNMQDLRNMQEDVHRLLQVADTNNKVEYSKTQANDWPSGIRTELRRQSIDIAPSFTYYWHSLSLLRRSLEYRICYAPFDELKKRVLAHDFTLSLSDPLMVKAWAAQLANVVIWIKQLGGKDYSDVFFKALQTVYPDEHDGLLEKQQYENKIYSMTHIILANSQYYQYPIDRKNFAWIYHYFDHNIDTIVSRAKSDVVAEVGIAYLLACDNDNPALEKTRQNIAQQYHQAQQMIPSEDGQFNIAAGAHRNILAIILLTSPQKFFPGPWLGQVGNAIKLPNGMHHCPAS